jgi:hypothetical protein
MKISSFTWPEVLFTLEMIGLVNTLKKIPVPVTPDAVTVTIPLVAPVGTVTTICVELQLLAVADAPLKATILAP